ncbi:MAG: ABC transporter ATP-binding protein [Caldilineaceae bacterium]|nr:ABC transporter ATP-binding protein [Caldilineaceae bacterium]
MSEQGTQEEVVTFVHQTGSTTEPPLILRDVHIVYKTRKGNVQAVRGVDLDLRPGESLALIGESGSGKTTLGLGIVRLLVKTAEISQGDIIYHRDGRSVNVSQLNKEDLRNFRWRECAMVFQSALNAFNPVIRIWNQMWDTAKSHGWKDKKAVREHALNLLRFVQLDAERVIDAYPHELSGGMRQRVLIALSLLLDPQVLILDEPTTALDILTQRTIIDLLRKLKEEQHFTMLFISHDLAIAAELADRLATMYAGRIVEIGRSEDIFYQPRHPYTLGLIRAVPKVTGGFQDLSSIPGSPPDLINMPTGCKFHPRCAFASDRCQTEEPDLTEVGTDHSVACWHWEAVAAEVAASPLHVKIEMIMPSAD